MVVVEEGYFFESISALRPVLTFERQQAAGRNGNDMRGERSRLVAVGMQPLAAVESFHIAAMNLFFFAAAQEVIERLKAKNNGFKQEGARRFAS